MKKLLLWKVLFSQTGSEILEISKKLGRFPDAIITNKSVEKLEEINEDLLKEAFSKFVFLPAKPGICEYLTAIGNANIVTLHGYLRILPAEVCSRYSIYNGHPALINLYPELKGKDPQKRIWEAKPDYVWHGHVIHKVIPEVDAGEIVSVSRFNKPDIHKYFKDLEDYCNYLRLFAIQNWVSYLKNRIIVNDIYE